MQSILKIMILIGYIVGVVLFIITFLGLKKLYKLNKDDVLSDSERERYQKYIKYMLIGFSILVIVSVLNLILLFLKKPY